MNILEDIKKQHDELMKKNGFVVHYTFPGEDSEETNCDYHTHGIKESFGHMDLQIVLPIDPNIVAPIINSMVSLIKEGERYDDKLISDKVIRGYDVQLVKVNVRDRELLRVIIPDENGKFPSDKDCAEGYRDQLIDVVSKKELRN